MLYCLKIVLLTPQSSYFRLKKVCVDDSKNKLNKKSETLSLEPTCDDHDDTIISVHYELLYYYITNN